MKSSSRKILLFLADILLNGFAILFLVVVLRFYVIAPFQVHGPSMCDAFNNFEGQCIRGNGEYIMIYKFGYQNILGWQVGLPQRGEVLVFHPPGTESADFFIKRVIGLPGDTVELREGYVYVNDEKLDEATYLNQVNLGHTEGQSTNNVFVVPEGNYFVLGDNRRASSDSRRCFEPSGCSTYTTPFITLDEIQGKAVVVFWPINRIRVVPDVSY
ncbi:MAG: hypothetical protein ACD_28C00077G0002 [uncultured bacterium]|nr:MAG: hypothetical protein ACD_28C00077G0002 [uncultured bacterium]